MRGRVQIRGLSWSRCLAALVLLPVVGCLGAEDPSQRLMAVGQLLDAQGAPLPLEPIESYQLTFVLAGDIEIERTFTEGIITDDQGMFRVSASDLNLSYDWQEDEYECQDVCIETETYCYDVEEDVCVSQCDVVTFDECYDECYDDCSGSTCYDETVCTTYQDDEGNTWEECDTETVCEDDCTTTCEPVCGSVTEEQCWDDCHVEVYEQCDEECVLFEEQCGWVTYTHTSYPELSEVVATRAEIAFQGKLIEGDQLRAHEEQECEQDDAGVKRCTSLGLWLQRDRFTVPADDDASSD